MNSLGSSVSRGRESLSVVSISVRKDQGIELISEGVRASWLIEAVS
jgi:hypothetical protein